MICGYDTYKNKMPLSNENGKYSAYHPFERQPRSQQMKYHEKTQCEHTVCKHGRYIYRCLGMRISVAYDTSKTEIYLL